MEAMALLKAISAAVQLGAEVNSLIKRLDNGDKVTEEEIKAATNELMRAINRVEDLD